MFDFSYCLKFLQALEIRACFFFAPCYNENIIHIEGDAMPNYSGGVSVCPFYCRESDLTISCGNDNALTTTDSSDPLKDCVLSVKFKSSETKLEYQKKYCLRYYYPYCPLAAFLLNRERKQ